ncbi:MULTISPECIES: potassium/proton antiporter [Bacteroides]|jgi:cell volume regulation protein A|uniref:potassium/proton antiporter n=1 Tax=Bacteroides TaxID=816 RepID=UPI000C78624F|nr:MULTISPECIES: potassium/proton antiporter [Bacteroides]RGM46796.1 potassium/proton antiporter [Bacteroides sp. OM08-11]
MLFTAENILLVGSILLFVSIIVGKTGYRFGVPALLLFLVVGMLFGSDGLGLQFHNAKEAQFIGMVALSIILFSGGMDTKYTEIKPILVPGIVLSTAGVLLTALFTGLFIWWLSGMSWTNIQLPLITSLLLASTMSSTDSASVFAILRSQKMNLKHNLRPMLELESGSNDPMAYMLTIVLIQFIQSSGMGVGNILGSFIIQFIVGAVAGYLLGKLAILMLNKLNIDNQSLYPILLLAFVFFTFSITDLLKGNGYLAVYIAGMMVGNNKIMYRKEIYTFMDGLTWLFQIIMFLCLGLLVNPHEMLEVSVVALLIGIFMIVIGRPLSVFLCLLPFGKKITMKSRLFISWVGLRGAVPIIFATYPVVANVPGAHSIFNIVFFITIVSLIVQGTTVSWVARILGLSTPLEKTGNDFGVELPEEIDSDLRDVTVTEEILKKGETLKDMNLPKGTLVMIVKRGDEYLIPNGTLKLHVGDKLLLISEKNKE